ncbi:chemotaxis protein CheW [Planctomicrobium sp.]|jgi:purine-binding chemotaxis protein CheW|nr:chemotaxis protein CheW [Planctomicrobium sp.]
MPRKKKSRKKNPPQGQDSVNPTPVPAEDPNGDLTAESTPAETEDENSADSEVLAKDVPTEMEEQTPTVLAEQATAESEVEPNLDEPQESTPDPELFSENEQTLEQLAEEELDGFALGDEALDPGSDVEEMMNAISDVFGDISDEFLDDMDDDMGDDSVTLDDLVQQIDDSLSGDSKAAKSAQPIEASNLRRFVVVELNGSLYGLAMDNVLEIQRVPKVTRLPRVPSWISGVANLRGTVISVVKLREVLGLPRSEEGDSTSRLVVVQSLVDDLETSLIVDRVIGIRNLPIDNVKPPTAQVTTKVAQYLRGVLEHNEQLIAILDLEKLLLSEEFRQFEAA